MQGCWHQYLSKKWFIYNDEMDGCRDYSTLLVILALLVVINVQPANSKSVVIKYNTSMLLLIHRNAFPANKIICCAPMAPS